MKGAAEPSSRPGPSVRSRRTWSLVLFVAMVVHTATKAWLGTLPELLWGCNVASLLIIVGLWRGDGRWVGTGFLWHACVGDLGWLYGVLVSGHTLWISVVMHTLPAVLGFLFLKRSGLPRSSPYRAFLLFVALVPVSHYLTPAGLNINFTHVRLAPLVARFPGNWDYRFAFSALMLAMLLAGDWGLSRVVGRPAVGAA